MIVGSVPFPVLQKQDVPSCSSSRSVVAGYRPHDLAASPSLVCVAVCVATEEETILETEYQISAELPVINRLRNATGMLHDRIEKRFDAVAELADPALRPLVIRRYAALHGPAHAALAPELDGVDGLDFASRSRAWSAVRWPPSDAWATPPFPGPADRWEALGVLYVVEGSTLGGRFILRELDTKGIRSPELSFLDPYGRAGGRMWRALLAVLEREGSRSPTYLESMCRGAMLGFLHAERVLCGDHL
jgi:heme oxygenase (biliverdin-IX-beta and delta-forming)